MGLHHRLKALTDPLGGMMQFEHDALGNLTKTLFGDGQQQLRNPDKVGNLFESPDQKDRQYDKGGKLLQSKGAKYKYDEAGNLIEKKDKDGKRWHYEWNGAGMLVKVIRPDREEVSFGYDALGRRVWKRYGNTVTKWVWDGDKPLHEWKEHALTGAILSDTKVGSDGIITWLFEEDSFAPVAKLKGEKKYSIITDHLGTPAQMYTEDGKLCWQGALDSYGRMRMEKGETGSCPFRYQGQYEDKEIGLYYNRFRYYSPEEGMYLSQDPIRLMGGNRLYGYVHDPNAWIDPFGLACKPKFNSQKKFKYSKGGSMSVLKHILQRHRKSTRYDEVSKFSSDSPKQISKLIKEGLENGEINAANKSITATFKRDIGTDINGNPTKQMQIFFDENGWVRTAFPL